MAQTVIGPLSRIGITRVTSTAQDDGSTAILAINANFTELYALMGAFGGYLAAAVISALSTNNYDPGTGFPSGYSRLDVTTSVQDNTLTGMLAGTNGQQMIVRNIGATYNLILTMSSGSSSAANRFLGQGTSFVIPPKNAVTLMYYAAPVTGWQVL